MTYKKKKEVWDRGGFIFVRFNPTTKEYEYTIQEG